MLETDLEIPAEFVALAADWYSGQSDMLYAVASTGGLTMGTLRPYSFDRGRPYTDEEWHWGLWWDLASDVGYAVRAAEGSDHPAVEALKRFEAFASDEASRLEALYGVDL